MELLNYHCFQDLNEEDKQRITQEAQKVILPSEYILYYAGDICDEVLFLKSGTVKIYIQPKELSYEEMTLYELQSGSQCAVNLFSTLSSAPTLANAITITPIEGWLLPKKTLFWLIENSSSFRQYKMQHINQRINALIQLLSDVKFTNIEQQLLNWLYVQGLDSIKITHESIANIIGVTRETVSRNLKKLEQKGYVHLNRGMISLTS